jgi:hypothetical protein
MVLPNHFADTIHLITFTKLTLYLRTTGTSLKKAAPVPCLSLNFEILKLVLLEIFPVYFRQFPILMLLNTSAGL